MKAFMIRWVLPFVMDLLIEGLKGMSSNTANSVDDKVITVIRDNKTELIQEILKRV